jgi:hypothetical protein
MAKRESATARFDHVQVDICPHGAGMILSVGAVSLWLTEPAAKEVACKLEAALRDSPLVLGGGLPASTRDGSN